MQETIRREFVEAMVTYEEMPREQWLFKPPPRPGGPGGDPDLVYDGGEPRVCEAGGRVRECAEGLLQEAGVLINHDLLLFYW